MKILFCNYEYPPLGGGGGVIMRALARELARRHEVTVITSQALDLERESDDGGVRVLRAPVFFRRQLAVANFPSMLAYLPSAVLRGLSLKRSAPRSSPRTPPFDVVNTHFVVPTGPVGQVLARAYGIPNVLSVHGGDLFDPSKRSSPHRHAWLRAPIRHMLNAADAVVGQSRDTVRHVAEIYGVQRTVELIPLGIDRPPRVPGATRAQLGLPDDAFVMLTIGRLVARKSSVQLVEALAQCSRPKAHLVFVGDGPDTPAVRRAAQEAGVADRVHLLGYVTEQQKSMALQVADIFVSSSQHEGFGLVFLEAMAFGLPVVCYDRGGQVDFLKSPDTGHVVKLNDLQAFTRALADLHDHEAQRQEVGRQNLQQVESFFIDRCAERYEAVFEAACAQRRRSAAQAGSEPSK
ncbi:MAG: glycosyltransferase family 4 protein [Steroidobacteraceae bacterium]